MSDCKLTYGEVESWRTWRAAVEGAGGHAEHKAAKRDV